MSATETYNPSGLKDGRIYVPDDTYYEEYKQILALFTTNTILKLEIKTDE